MGYTYADAGVDIQTADNVKARMKRLVRTTFRPEVLSDVGLFGGLFKLQGYKHPVLVSSVDGVGTKLKIASGMGRYDTLGQDLVNHCVNDILCCGASPLFFLDYIAMGSLMPMQVESLVKGLASACKINGCALIGGETAEMPDVYSDDDFDLVGFIVGVIERDGLKDSKSITHGDIVFGLPSSGLHTNGYSLVRRIFARRPLDFYYPELGRTLGEELLEIHRCYYPALKNSLPWLKGLAHITGGGLEGNVPRILPPGIEVRIRRGTWSIPPIFDLIQKEGQVEREEMYRVFNMGIGMVVVCPAERGGELVNAVPDAFLLGEVLKSKGSRKGKFILE